MPKTQIPKEYPNIGKKKKNVKFAESSSNFSNSNLMKNWESL